MPMHARARARARAHDRVHHIMWRWVTRTLSGAVLSGRGCHPCLWPWQMHVNDKVRVIGKRINVALTIRDEFSNLAYPPPATRAPTVWHSPPLEPRPFALASACDSNRDH
eukprot:6052378-Prymnesium_polylepis.1